ncbi:MAG: metallophosphoesterase [Verrucomicrobia bacterium]|nr:metallophosphoesterase [Verrucomicrobiota bacterium]
MIMLLLFPVVLLSYAAMHVYMGIKLRLAFPRLKQWTALLVMAATLLFIGPFLTRWFGNRGYVTLAWLAGAVGYTWIAVVFWFFSLGLVLDTWNLLVRLISLLMAGEARWHIPARRAVQAVGLVIALAIAWGMVEARRLHVETIVLKTDRLPAGKTIRIVQISDLHLTAHRGASLVPRVLDAVQSLAPDILVSTGDLVDSPFEAVRGYAVALRGLSPPGGRFAVLGNHEYYTGLKQAFAFHEAAGFSLLRGRLVKVAPVNTVALRRRLADAALEKSAYPFEK